MICRLSLYVPPGSSPGASLSQRGGVGRRRREGRWWWWEERETVV